MKSTGHRHSLSPWRTSRFIGPVTYMSVLLIILGVLIYSIYHKANIDQATDIKILSERVVRNIELKLSGNLDFIKLIAKERSYGNITEQTFESHVKHYLNDHPEFINITWVDSNYVIKSVCPMAGNSHIIGLHLQLPEPKRVSNLARKNKECLYTKPFEAIQGNSSFEVWVPVFKDSTFIGLLAGVYSCPDVLKQSLPASKKSKTNFRLIDANNELLTNLSEYDPTEKGISHQASLSALGNGMKVEVQMQNSQPFTWLTGLLIIISILLLIGFLFSLYTIKSEMQKRHKIQDSLKTSEDELKRQNSEYLALNEVLIESNNRIQSINQELQLAKEKAEESEETYRMLFDSINDAVFVLEPDNSEKLVRYINVNDIACERLGYTREELLNQSPFDINSERKRPEIPDFIKRLLENNHAITETEHVTKDGRIIPVEVNASVTHFKNRIIFHSIVRDITERKLNELRIREKSNKIEAQNKEYQHINEELKHTVQRLTDVENRLQFALMAGELGTWDWDIEAGKILWSDISKEMSGIPPEAEIDYNIFLNTVIPEDRDLINKLVWESLNEKKDYKSEYRVKWPDGTIHWIQVMGRGIYNDLGKPVHMIGVGMEITDRKNAELALEHSHKLMSYIIQHNPGCVAVFDKELRYIYVSQRYMNDFNITESNLIGKYHYDIFPNLDQKFIDAHKKTLKGEIVRSEDDSYYREDGSLEWTRWETRPWFEADGSIGGIIMYIEIITERIQQKLEIIAAKEKAEESDRLKTAFLQNMSHEIRTPMNAIMGFSSLLNDNFNNKNKLEQFSKIITQRSNDLLDIINDILDIAKIESGQLPVYMEKCNLFELFDDLTTFFAEYKERIKKDHINFNLEVLCQQDNKVIITDKVKLKQILINLITNAFKFTDKGEIKGGCKIDENNRLIFYISDTGIGIPKDKQKIIFERFSQLNQNPGKIIGGTGLGLPIVKGLVHLLGGEVFLDSAPGKGSTFSFTISYKDAKVPKPEKNQEKSTDLKEMGKHDILVVEDDLHNAEYLKEILSINNLEVIHTQTGENAVLISNTQKVDLILMDIRLPGMDGYEATRLILQRNPGMKIIAQTAYASSDERQKALDAGCIDYVSKPTKKETLLAVINNWLEKK